MKTNQKYWLYGTVILAIVAIVAISVYIKNIEKTSTLIIGDKLSGESCLNNTECKSGICGYAGRELKCAPEICSYGGTYGYHDYFCNDKKRWEKVKEEGFTCNLDIECKTNVCDKDKNICISYDEYCLKQGLRAAALNCDQPTQVSMDIILGCVPCGNGVCDTSESKCNCPEDCK